jgi:tetratricopeptide (TPR) repeat protein
VSQTDQREPIALPPRTPRWVDRSLIATITALAALLACQELFDADAWWHLRAGQWILSNGRLPTLDPFSFGSADRPWIDLQWIFQILLALSYRAAGVAGMTLLAAAACSATLLIVLCTTVRGPRSWLIALIWLPALLLLSTRVQPRPEVFSLLFTATYVTILDRCDRRPGLAWLLPPVQVVWVNMHSLFILGPALMAAYVAGAGKRRWGHVGLASVAVVAACLVNPYGIRGALFPLELLPKITAWGGPYKAYIGEFHDPRTYMQNEAVAAATRNLFYWTEFFLFLMIPISFLMPAVWQARVVARRSVRAPAEGRLFRVITSAAFGFLALQAVRNASFFALVSGFVIARNFNDWIARLGAGHNETQTRVAIRIDRALGAVLTSLLWLAIVAAAAGWWSPVKWGLFPMGLRERPLTFAHAAARFAGRPGMPGHALVFELAQAAVYLFHNAPERRPFIDPRLEVPTQKTFETYVQLDHWLNVGHPAWSEVIGRMGNPLILLDHAKNCGAEATLLIDPRWRCVHFDAVASVFLPRSRADLEPLYPTIDFAGRHFQRTALAGVTGDADEGRGEARGLVLIGLALVRRKDATWMHRIPVLLLASDRARAAVARAPADARAWLALGDALWSQAPDLLNRPSGPVERWDPARSLSMAQATVAYRRTVALDPATRSAVSTLSKAYAFRGMGDAQGPVATLPSWRTVSELRDRVEELLRHGRPGAAVALVRDAEQRRIALPWDVVDRVAITHLHLGAPDAARKLWQRAADCPSPALRLARIAEAHLAALDYEASRGSFLAALDHDRGLGEAWYGLALLELQEGHASETVIACRQGLTCALTDPQRASLENMETLAARFAQP